MRNFRMAVAMVASVLLIGACSSSAEPSQPATPSQPTAASVSPTPSPTSTETFTVTVASWQFELTPATQAPPDWPADIPGPESGVVQATGTGEPTFTTSDHPIVAVQSMAPGEVAAVRSGLARAMTAAGWKDAGKDHGAQVFIKGNNSARVAVVANASTGGVTVYQWT